MTAKQKVKGKEGALERFENLRSWWAKQFQAPTIITRQQKRFAARIAEKKRLSIEKSARRRVQK
jgi:RNase P subunit RPR2